MKKKHSSIHLYRKRFALGAGKMNDVYIYCSGGGRFLSYVESYCHSHKLITMEMFVILEFAEEE